MIRILAAVPLLLSTYAAYADLAVNPAEAVRMPRYGARTSIARAANVSRSAFANRTAPG